MKNVNMILAHDLKGGIGIDNGLPWPRNKEDMKWFYENTKDGIIVMGRKTWESIGSKKLSDRTNIVLSNSEYVKDCDLCLSGINTIQALNRIRTKYPYQTLWIIGGKQVFYDVYRSCDKLYFTQFNREYEADTHIDVQMLKQGRNKIYEKGTDMLDFTIWH